ncbi:MAG: DUF1549 and DUF1553 domain-containing protein [Planctomycetaceae bacterium]
MPPVPPQRIPAGPPDLTCDPDLVRRIPGTLPLATGTTRPPAQLCQAACRRGTPAGFPGAGVRRWILALLSLLPGSLAGISPVIAGGEGPARSLSSAGPVANPAAVDARIAELAADIDRFLDDRLAQEQVVAAPLADDAEFFRRVSLDVAGRVPRVAALREFLADTRPDKRRRAVDDLLAGPAYVAHFARVWRGVMIPEADSNPEVRFLLPPFEAWLRRRLLDNIPYDRLVREILEMTVDPRQADNPFQPQPGLNALSYYQSKQLKPENLAASTARMFLGVRIECAQCHDHPFDEWKQEQFWGYAAFFAGLKRDGNADAAMMQINAIEESLGPTQLEIPLPGKTVTPTHFDGSQPTLGSRDSPRRILANWMVSPENGYFARTLVNRLWGQFFGTGIVHPIDDFTAENPPSHPELLDRLARMFVDSGHDLKLVIRVLTATQAYQRTSRQTDASQTDPRLFSRMAVKGLTPDQIFDSIAQATGFREDRQRNMSPLGDPGSARGEFVQMFENTRDSQTETQTTILQALAMMNGRFVADATSPGNSQTLAALIDFPLMTQGERIETLYMAALGRPPEAEEMTRLENYVQSGGPTGDWKQALGDVFWSLLNSSEFLFNR